MDAPIVKAFPVAPNATRTRPRMPCCPQRQYGLDISGGPTQDYTITCPVCGRAWDVTRTTRDDSVSGRVETFTWTPQGQTDTDDESFTGVDGMTTAGPAEPSTGGAALTDTPAPPDGGTDAARAALADAMGVAPADIAVRRPEWARYAQEGAHVHVTFRRWRANTRATLEDLGLAPDLPRFDAESDADYNKRVKGARDAILRVLKLGEWRLLPLDYLKKCEKIEVRGRTYIEDFAHKTYWGWWIHASLYQDWYTGHQKIAADYDALGDEIYDKWDELQAQVRADLMEQGRAAYGRARNSAAYRAGVLNLPDTADEFASSFVDRVTAQVPSRDIVRAKHGSSFSCEMIPLASQIATDETAAGTIRMNAASAQMLDDIRRTEAKKTAEGVQRFVADIQGQIRGAVYDVVVDALDALEQDTNNRLPVGSATKLRNLCTKVSRVMFWDDPDLESRLAEIRALVDVAPDQRDAQAISGALTALGAQSRLVLLELDRAGDRRARPEFDLSDSIDDLTKVARRDRAPKAADAPEIGADGPVGPDAAPVLSGPTRGDGNGRRAAVGALSG